MRRREEKGSKDKRWESRKIKERGKGNERIGKARMKRCSWQCSGSVGLQGQTQPFGWDSGASGVTLKKRQNQSSGRRGGWEIKCRAVLWAPRPVKKEGGTVGTRAEDPLQARGVTPEPVSALQPVQDVALGHLGISWRSCCPQRVQAGTDKNCEEEAAAERSSCGLSVAPIPECEKGRGIWNVGGRLTL